MEKRLFVGNLPFSITSEDLRNLFAPYGEIISADVIINRMSNRSKGFGFVEFSTPDQAQSAIDGLNDTEQDGRKIVVSFARPKAEQSETPNSNSQPAPQAVEEPDQDNTSVETDIDLASSQAESTIPEVTDTDLESPEPAVNQTGEQNPEEKP